jgi:hypothetical protein
VSQWLRRGALIFGASGCIGFTRLPADGVALARDVPISRAVAARAAPPRARTLRIRRAQDRHVRPGGGQGHQHVLAAQEGVDERRAVEGGGREEGGVGLGEGVRIPHDRR